MNITPEQQAKVLKLLNECKNNCVVIEEKCDRIFRNMEHVRQEFQESIDSMIRMQNQLVELRLRLAGQLKPAPWNKPKDK